MVLVPLRVFSSRMSLVVAFVLVLLRVEIYDSAF